MSLEIIAAKDFNHAFEIVSMDPEKRMEDHSSAGKWRGCDGSAERRDADTSGSL